MDEVDPDRLGVGSPLPAGDPARDRLEVDRFVFDKIVEDLPSSPAGEPREQFAQGIPAADGGVAPRGRTVAGGTVAVVGAMVAHGRIERRVDNKPVRELFARGVRNQERPPGGSEKLP